MIEPLRAFVDALWLRANLARHREDVRVYKIEDPTGFGLHSYQLELLDRTGGSGHILGSGTHLSPFRALRTAWSELVERTAFTAVANSGGAITSNGFAAHPSAKVAADHAVAELVERDVFLSAWLLEEPARPVDELSGVALQVAEWLRPLGIRARFGVFGVCMDYCVGLTVLTTGDKFALGTAARRSRHELLDSLALSAVSISAGFISSQPLAPIDNLSTDARPMDHRSYYLLRGTALIDPWILSGTAERAYPAFRYRVDDVTEAARRLEPRGIHVMRATSEHCQDLWFGPSKLEVVNQDRLSAISPSRDPSRALNLQPHPLA